MELLISLIGYEGFGERWLHYRGVITNAYSLPDLGYCNDWKRPRTPASAIAWHAMKVSQRDEAKDWHH